MSAVGLDRREHVVHVEGGHLLCVTDHPAGEPKATAIICHGLTGDRVGPQRLLTVLAEELVMFGFVSVRFDFRGSGDSSGVFAETTFAGMCDDLRSVAAWAEREYSTPALTLLGVSIGGVIPALCARELPGVTGVALISSDLVEDVVFPIHGNVPIRGGEFHLPDSFYREREDLYPLTELYESGIPAKLFYGARDEKLVEAADRFAAVGLPTHPARGQGHLFEDVDERGQLGRRIARFLCSTLPGENEPSEDTDE
ncbi:MAG: alpha/beta fold hydrolase [Acidimicrobiia bacterium]